MSRWKRWRHRQPTRILYVPASDPAPTIVPAGLRPKNRNVTVMVETRVPSPL